jgi:hypothetical protein
MIHKTLQEKLARSEATKMSRLRRRDGIHQFEPRDQHRDAFNKGTTPDR